MSSTAPTCPGPTLTIHINFPDCWNGTALDSPDHKSHLAYHNPDGTCPAGFPVPIPRVRVNVHYPTTGGSGVALASGGQYSGTPTSSTRGFRASSSTSCGRASTPAGSATRADASCSSHSLTLPSHELDLAKHGPRTVTNREAGNGSPM